MSAPLRVLIVEDSEDDMILMVRELRRHDYDLTYTRVQTPEAMSAALDSQDWDVILSDFSMPEFSALAALKVAQGKGGDIPFIIVSGTAGEEAAVTAMKAGAQDFFPKNKLTRH
jgi:DNA-binding NtrC family response regulator